jgi:NADH dehydrogenase
MTVRRRVLVLGGTGFVGRALCERLIERHPGLRITVPTRRAIHARAVQWLPGVEPLQRDVHDDRQLAQLLQGHDAVINLIAILHGRQGDFDRVHVQFAQRLAALCIQAGVRRVVHVSALGVGVDAPSMYLRSKAQAEGVLRAAPLELSLLRPSVMFGAEDRFMNLFARMQALLPIVPLAGADALFQPVWVADVAEAIARCLDRPSTAGQTYQCAGPEVHSLSSLVRLAGSWSGNERKVLALPESLGRAQAWLMEKLPGQPLMSRDNLASMRVANVATDTLPGLQALDIEAAAMAAVVPGYLAPGKGITRLNRWRAGRSRS